jgi:hypothetical protein
MTTYLLKVFYVEADKCGWRSAPINDVGIRASLEVVGGGEGTSRVAATIVGDRYEGGNVVRTTKGGGTTTELTNRSSRHL